MSDERGYDELLGEAVRVLTEAARSTRPVGVDGQRREQADWAEFVALAVAGAAANVGGVEAVLAGRSGSWEADLVRQLLAGTVGPEEQYLLAHRTEPVTVVLHVDDILLDRGAWDAYDAAVIELDRQAGAAYDRDLDDPEREPLLDQFAELEERVERLREQDWAAYGQALKANVEAAAARRYPDLPVPVIVTVDLSPVSGTVSGRDGWGWGEGIVERLRAEAIETTPLPGAGLAPLQRLDGDAEQRHDTAGGESR
jgi:hypothetical protein